MLVPDDDVGVLARLERADAIVDAQLLCGIDGDEGQRLVFAQTAPVHALGGLGVEPARVLGAVGVDRDEHAALVHDRRVVGNRVLGLDLVGPPVGERRSAGAVRRHLVGDLVAFEHVLEGGDLESHLVGDANQHQDLVGAVGVGVHEPLAFEDLDERLELEIAARGEDRRGIRGIAVRGLAAALVVLPVALIGLGARECVADDVLDPGARDRISARRLLLTAAAEAHVLRVFTQRKLDPRHGALEDHLARREPFPTAA